MDLQPRGHTEFQCVRRRSEPREQLQRVFLPEIVKARGAAVPAQETHRERGGTGVLHSLPGDGEGLGQLSAQQCPTDRSNICGHW